MSISNSVQTKINTCKNFVDLVHTNFVTCLVKIEMMTNSASTGCSVMPKKWPNLATGLQRICIHISASPNPNPKP